jgi:ferredoxin-type protein NapG
MASSPPHKAEQARRRFLRALIGGGALLAAGTAGWLPLARGGQPRLRPPGALEEDDFLASCIKCGQCVQVCPVEALKLADLTDGYGVGTPYIDARAQACDFSCDAVQCILACPTGALSYVKPKHLATRAGMRLAGAPILLAKEKDPEPKLNLKERAGVARLARPDLCLARQGKGWKGPSREAGYKGMLRFMEVDRWKPIPLNEHPFNLELCDLCVRACPIKGAITLEALEPDQASSPPAPPPPVGEGRNRKTPVVREPCVGCGVCEMVCPTEPAAIVIDPRRGWEA